jgi:lipopolysaccharide biosynthesis protein
MKIDKNLLVENSSSLLKIKSKIKKWITYIKLFGFREFFNKIAVRITPNYRRGESESKKNEVSNSRNPYFRIYLDYLNIATITKNDYIYPPPKNLNTLDKKLKLVAFYLPQFHPIPENDLWWGKGFTEWTNVTKAVPQFPGHYQPHLPGELGFYDLRVPEIRRRQVELAKEYGISGFCFYYYWFNGKRLLEQPLDDFINDPNVDFPFCICWANENWTRRWDGAENELLIGQSHSFESDIKFIKSIEKIIKHKNYIRYNGNPLLIIYRSQIMPNPRATADSWRGYCRENGIGEICLVAAQTFGFLDPTEIGFDAAVEFPPHNLDIPKTNDLPIANPVFEGTVYDYRNVATYCCNKPAPDFPLFKTVMPSWDNTARNQSHSQIFINSSPHEYQKWLEAVLDITSHSHPKGEGIVFINAWNEWAEGAHLEPDRKFGYGYLDATLNALNSNLSINDQQSSATLSRNSFVIEPSNHETAIILHLYYLDLWNEINSYLKNLDNNFDLYVSLNKESMFFSDVIKKEYPKSTSDLFENYGRDIAPFIRIYSGLVFSKYKYICKIHTKKSLIRNDGDKWRREILKNLLGSKSEIQKIKSYLDRGNIGLIGPKNCLLSTEYYMGDTESMIFELCSKLGINYQGENFNFIAGSMFWFDPKAILSIERIPHEQTDFPVESGQKDGTYAHAIERIIGLIAVKNGYKVIQAGDYSEKPVPKNRFRYATPMPREYYQNLHQGKM